MQLELPFGASGLFEAPETTESEVIVDGKVASTGVRLGPGHHAITVTRPRIHGNRTATSASTAG